MNRTPISYYGGKQRMLSDILPLIPKHKIYVEPYFGGGALFFAKSPADVEVINDTNGNVVNFYDVLKNNFSELLSLIDCSLYSEELHIMALKIYRSKRGFSKVKRAWAFWFVTNFSYANKIGGGWKFDNGTGGSHIGITFERKKAEFHQYESRLQKVQISNRDAVKVIKDRNRKDVFLFLDPPYVDSDQGHYKGYTQSHFDELLKALSEFDGMFMLCHFSNNKLMKAVRKFNWHVKAFDKRCSAPKESNRRKRELVITNYLPTPSLFPNNLLEVAI